MISLEQIKLLEKKVSDAVHLIHVLKEENKTLKRTIESSQQRMQELEELVTTFKHDQTAIETTVLNAIQKLDILEDELAELETKGKATPEEKASSQMQEQTESAQPETYDELKEEDNTNLTTETLVTSNEFELEQEDEEVITVDDLKAANADQAGLAEIRDRPLSDPIADTDENLTESDVNIEEPDGQSDFLFFNQNLNDKQYNSLEIDDGAEREFERSGLHLQGNQPLYQNKIYIQRQTEFKELDIF